MRLGGPAPHCNSYQRGLLYCKAGGVASVSVTLADLIALNLAWQQKQGSDCITTCPAITGLKI